MCGRYLIKSDIEEIINKYGIDMVKIEYMTKEEIFPSDTAPVIINEGKKELRFLKWGFNLPYSKSLIINARSETIEEKSIFRSSFYERRCILPANGFFEWKKEGSKNTKYLIKLKSDSLFSLAGIYGNFLDKNGLPYTGFTIITVSPNELVSGVHDRMPLILDAKDEDMWLKSDPHNPEEARKLIKSYRSSNMLLSPA